MEGGRPGGRRASYIPAVKSRGVALRVLVTGSTGLLGRALCQDLDGRGHEVWTLDRRASGPRSLVWTQDAGSLARLLPAELGAVVHLAGAPIATWPWTSATKQVLWDSRVGSTGRLAQALASLARNDGGRPLLISGSAVGIYPSGWPAVDEDGPVNAESFMGQLCLAWEGATEAARDAGLRVAILRTGLVLDPAGGLLAKLLPVWKAGLGGCLGSRDTPWSWIHREDWLGAVRFILKESLDGPFNLCAPQPLPQAEALRCLGRVLRRPGVCHVPAFLLKLGGEMAREVLLQAPAARPRRLLEAGFTFRHGELEQALIHLLKV